MDYLEYYNFITPDQSAYLQFHSTHTVLHKVVDSWLEAMDEGLINGVCFIDFSKCFNTIDPDILLLKLQKYGIRGNTHRWFSSYFTGRKQCTIINGNLSKFHDVKIGIPQGSFLGNILFLLFMNDLSMYVSNLTQFADDTMLDVHAVTVDDAVTLLQTEIDKMSVWCARNRLSINISKTCSMLIGTRQRIKDYCGLKTLGLKIQGQLLCNQTKYTYLGLEIDCYLSWNYNVSKVCKKLGSRIAITQRLIKYLPSNNSNSIYHTNTLYFSFIQPYIDYGLTVWGNTSSSNIKKIQHLQNRMARIISGNFDYTVPGITFVKDLGWQDISARKRYLTSILMYQ